MRGPAWAAALTAVLLTAGCTADDGAAPAPSPTGTAGTSAGPTPSGAGEPAVVRSAPLDGGVLEIGLHPLVRVAGPAAVGDLVVLTLDLAVAEAPADGEISLGDLFREPLGDRTPMGAVRLLDLRADTAHSVATDTAGEGVLTEGYSGLGGVEEGGAVRLQAAYAAPPAGTPDVAVLLPGTGLVDALAVVDGEVPGPAPETGTATADGATPLDLDGAVTAAVRPLEVYAEDLQGTVRTETSDAGARVALAADVLFALDSAELSPDARAVLETAAADVLTRRPGPVSVVGHTDDQGTDDYNLDLSRRRAQAVADVLGPLLGVDYPLQVDGRGEAEPAVPGTSADARARNRRVELVVSTPSTGAALGRRTEEALPPPAATAAGPEGVVVERQTGWPFRVRTAAARRVQGNVVVDLEITALPATTGAAGLPPAPSLFSTFRDPRDFAVTDGSDTVRGAVLLQGSTAVFPLFSAVGDAPSPRLCACGLNVRALAEGQVLTASAVYPDLDADEVVLQNTPVTTADVALRLTGIPVTG